jgi:hypothetical protein
MIFKILSTFGILIIVLTNYSCAIASLNYLWYKEEFAATDSILLIFNNSVSFIGSVISFAYALYYIGKLDTRFYSIGKSEAFGIDEIKFYCVGRIAYFTFCMCVISMIVISYYAHGLYLDYVAWIWIITLLNSCSLLNANSPWFPTVKKIDKTE